MKKIEVIIRPEKLEDVRQALRKIGCSGMMITEIEGHGRQKGFIQQWRGEKYKLELLPKIKIEIVVKDIDTERIVNTIIESARTGEIGDGKIFISPVEEVIRIRTSEKGETAL
ncbi:MAG: P-II family nitrogen regulator [Candidatus Omnitrophica bacterium]|nr:P-II family nitrogen regulator [Candidatus Omnitrophota bacterium]